MSQFYSLTIKDLIKETPDAISIVFDVPLKDKADFTFVAGQYVTLKATINNQEVRRAYSLCSSPNSNEIKVAIKAIENGLFSTFATSNLSIGDVIDVSVPQGKFSLIPQEEKRYLGFAAGSGITPILSMIKSVLETQTSSTFTLIYGNKNIEHTIFYTELNALQKKFPNHLKVHYIFSREEVEGSLFGRINRAHTNYFLKDIYTTQKFNDVFLCGPETMIDVVIGTLIENDYNSEIINYELFTASNNEQEEVSSETTDDNGTSEIKVVLDDEETTFTMDQKDTILAAALRNNLDAPYSCQGGVCSSCIAKVTEGKAIMTKNQILSKEELEEGFILTCKAHPTTNKIVVDFDDV